MKWKEVTERLNEGHRRLEAEMIKTGLDDDKLFQDMMKLRKNILRENWSREEAYEWLNKNYSEEKAEYTVLKEYINHRT